MEKNIATNDENKLAQEYYDFVNNELRGRMDNYLDTNNMKKITVLNNVKKIQGFYKRMFDIQYNISQIVPDTILQFTKVDSNITTKINVNIINEQAKNWLNRLSSILNVLTIKASEFNENEAKIRDSIIFLFSIIISSFIGYFINDSFDRENDKDLSNQTVEIKRHQDSITTRIRQEYILNFDTLKHNMNNRKKI